MALKPATLPEPTDSIREEAAIWLTRLRDGGESVRAQFEAWRTQNPAHAAAFKDIAALFDAFELPTQVLAERDAIATAPDRGGRGWRIAASVVLCAVLVGWQSDRLADLRSDAVTVAGETTTLTLGDGSKVSLNTRTSLRAIHVDGVRGVHLSRGEAYFDVAKDPHRPFIVEAGHARVQVLGTRFNVRMNEDDVIVTVDEGRVALANVTNRSETGVILTDGQQGSLEETAVQVRSNVDVAASLAWRSGKVIFYETPLAEVVEELNRYRTSPILVIGRPVRERRISGMFNLPDTDSAITNIERTFQIRTVRLPAGLTILY